RVGTLALPENRRAAARRPRAVGRAFVRRRTRWRHRRHGPPVGYLCRPRPAGGAARPAGGGRTPALPGDRRRADAPRDGCCTAAQAARRAAGRRRNVLLALRLLGPKNRGAVAAWPVRARPAARLRAYAGGARRCARSDRRDRTPDAGPEPRRPHRRTWPRRGICPSRSLTIIRNLGTTNMNAMTKT